MTLPTTRNPLSPPPFTGDRVLHSWLQDLYKAVGEATDTAKFSVAGTSNNITGILASANASPNIVKNMTNDATGDSIDAGADATVRVYGPAGLGSNWTRYRNGAQVGAHPAVTFTGKAYSTRYYIGFNPTTGSWTISTAFKNVTGDSLVTFSVQTVAAGGGGGISGGGGSGAGGSGGVGGGGSGYGLLL